MRGVISQASGAGARTRDVLTPGGCPSHPGEGPASAEQTCPDLLGPTFVSRSPFWDLGRAHWEVASGSHGARPRGHGAICPQASLCFQGREPSPGSATGQCEAAGWDAPPPHPTLGPAPSVPYNNLCTGSVPDEMLPNRSTQTLHSALQPRT